MAFSQLKVQHDGVAYRCLQRCDSVGLGFRMPYHFDVIEGRDGLGEALANHRRILDEENAKRVYRFCAWF